MKRFFCGLALSVLTLAAIPGTEILAASNTIAKGIKIGDIDVSEMTVAEAKEAVEKKVQQVIDGELVLTGGNGKKVTVKGAELGLSWSNPDVVKTAYAVGHEGNVVERYKEGKDVEENSVKFDIEYGIDDDALSTVIRKCSTEFNSDLQNVDLAKEKAKEEKDKKATKEKRERALKEGEGDQPTGITGYLVNMDESKSILKDFIANSWTPENNEVELSVRTVDAFKNEEALQKMSDVLGTYTTRYKDSGAARSANIENACALLNGITLEPGEELSILDTITPFSEENGYYPAGSYLNGLVVESIGGGICQVSSTLYNAVLLAELDVTERHNHSMIVSYVEPSADAAIAQSGGKDFKFRNNTDFTIYIEGVCTPDKHVTFTIYGHDTRPAGRKVTYKSVILKKTPASEDKYMTDPSQALGYVGMQSAHLGYKSQLCKVVEENGVESATKVINTSTYNMVPRIIMVGTKGADQDAITELKSAMETKDIKTIRTVAQELGKKKSETTAVTTDTDVQPANKTVTKEIGDDVEKETSVEKETAVEKEKAVEKESEVEATEAKVEKKSDVEAKETKVEKDADEEGKEARNDKTSDEKKSRHRKSESSEG
ncbi:MAG: VanW family protein [Butyrivibrio sp.]|nr:VanW family protein [Butyrivibrio sp.]